MGEGLVGVGSLFFWESEMRDQRKAREQRAAKKPNSGQKARLEIAHEHPRGRLVRLNKTALIRKTAQELQTKMPLVRPRDIVKALEKQGVDVTSPQVSMALRGTNLAYRQKRTYAGRPQRNLSQRAADVSVDDVLKAREFVRQIGSVEKADAALFAYRQFRDDAVLRASHEQQTDSQPAPSSGPTR